MDHKNLSTELDKIWFPEAMTKLIQSGETNAIFKVFEFLKRDESKQKQLERHLERAIGDMIDEWSPEDQAKFKQQLDGYILVTIGRAKSMYALYSENVTERIFTGHDQQKAAGEYIWEILVRERATGNHTLEDCIRNAGYKVRLTFSSSSNICDVPPMIVVIEPSRIFW